MRKFGIKLWSKDFVKNPGFTEQNIAAVKDGRFDYVELFAIPETYDELHNAVYAGLKDVPVVIHAPHSVFGVDTGNAERFEQNRIDLESSFRFADLLKSEIIILHPGFNEDEEALAESIRQFRRLHDSRLVIENMPAWCASTKRALHASSPAQIKRFIEEAGCRFCLDFSHAVCAANYYGRDKLNDLKEYQRLNPCIYHLCDGDWNGDKDEHRHYGEGNYPLGELLQDYTDSDAMITMETGHGIPTGIQPWLKDIAYLKGLL